MFDPLEKQGFVALVSVDHFAPRDFSSHAYRDREILVYKVQIYSPLS